MVGVASTNDEPDIDVIEPFDTLERETRRVGDTAVAMLDDAQMVGWEILDFRIVGGVTPTQQSQHPRLRARFLVLGCDAASTVRITIGTRSFDFPLAIGTVVIPFPVIIDRGVDLTIAATAGAANCVGYVIGDPE